MKISREMIEVLLEAVDWAAFESTEFVGDNKRILEEFVNSVVKEYPELIETYSFWWLQQ